jgi:hypothetical protein
VKTAKSAKSGYIDKLTRLLPIFILFSSTDFPRVDEYSIILLNLIEPWSLEIRALAHLNSYCAAIAGAKS